MRDRLAVTNLATSLGFLLVQLDVSVINVATASIANRLQTDVTGLQWVVDAYALTFASLLLSAGALGDRIGARRCFAAGLGEFVLASLACAAAPTAAALIIARAAQGVGASALVPCSLALISHACNGDSAARARAVSLWTAAGSVGLAIGPVLGGAMITAFGWRSIFLINLPIGACGIGLAWRFVDETLARPGHADMAGQAAAIAGLFCLTDAVIEAQPLGLSSRVVWAGALLALAAFGLFFTIERRKARPMLPFGFFSDVAFSAATSVGFLLNLALYGGLFVIGLAFQQLYHWSPVHSGIALLPFAAAIFVANLAAGRIVARAGPRMLMAAGLAIAALGTWLLRGIEPATPYAVILPGLILLPSGIGLTVPVMTSVLLATVPPSRAGVASGVLNAVRQAGGAIGVALFGGLMAGGQVGVQHAFTAGTILLLLVCIVAACFIGGGRSIMLPPMARRGDAAGHG